MSMPIQSRLYRYKLDTSLIQDLYKFGELSRSVQGTRWLERFAILGFC